MRDVGTALEGALASCNFSRDWQLNCQFLFRKVIK